MKTIQEIIDNYKDYQTPIQDRFGARFASWLEAEQLEAIGFSPKDGVIWKREKEWTEDIILDQLYEDVDFGLQKANDERGISSSLMYAVVGTWCKVLENGIDDTVGYEPYGKPLFYAVAHKYGWNNLLGQKEES